MPGIADPGHTLVKVCLQEGINFTVLPGPSALLTAVVLSGLPTTDIRFLGFIPKKKLAKERFFQTLKYQPSTLVFFETALRLKETLALAAKVFGQRQAFVGRELTKKFEQHMRGTIEQIAAKLKETVLKGELVLVIQGATTLPPISKEEVKALIRLELEKGGAAAEAIKIISESFGLPKKQLYELYLELKTASRQSLRSNL
jgi:16S rRNA (cytidine1402-2'-O)-methyltransferase